MKATGSKTVAFEFVSLAPRFDSLLQVVKKFPIIRMNNLAPAAPSIIKLSSVTYRIILINYAQTSGQPRSKVLFYRLFFSFFKPIKSQTIYWENGFVGWNSNQTAGIKLGEYNYSTYHDQ